MKSTFRLAQFLALRSSPVRSSTASAVVLSLFLLGVACSDRNPLDPAAVGDDEGAAETDSPDGGGDTNPVSDKEDDEGSGDGAIELGTLGGTFSVATAINDHGDVVGYSETAQGEMRAFLWTADEGMRNLGTPDGDSRAFGLNNHREVVGWFEGDLGRMQFLWSEGDGMVDISDPWAGMAFDINDHGRVAGHRWPSSKAAMYTRDEGWVENANCPDFSYIHSINNQNEAVGHHQATYSLISPEYPDGGGPIPSTGFYVAGPGADCQDLRDDDWYATRAMGIADDGRMAAVAGPSRFVDPVVVEFLETLQPARLADAETIEFAGGGSPVLSVPWKPSYVVEAINEKGTIVGSDPERRAFRWPAGGEVSLIEETEVESAALDINASGDVVGWRMDGQGRTQAVLWSDRADPAVATTRVEATAPRVVLRQRSDSHPEVARCPGPLGELVRLRALDECPVPTS